MADKPRGVCRYDMDECGLHCAHPLHNHFYGDHPSIWTVKDGHRGLCISCPCHEPQPDPTPASRFVQVACWCERCDLDANSGMATRMALCPQCGDKRCSRAGWHENECSANRPTPTGKAGHDKP